MQDTDSRHPLPGLAAVRTHATVRGNEAIVVQFTNGARLRYVAADGAVYEEWLRPGDDEPARTTERPDAKLHAAALNVVGEFLTFDDSRRAAFTWGEENLAVIVNE